VQKGAGVLGTEVHQWHLGAKPQLGSGDSTPEAEDYVNECLNFAVLEEQN